MPIRNPFKRAGADVDLHDSVLRDSTDRGFEKTNVMASRPIEIKEPAEYKLCEINDSGIYLPPSPTTEKKGFWQTSSRTSTSSNHRSLLAENEPFNISRESFDSYRRSFDISARSPIPDRISLDSRRFGSRPSFDRRSSRPSIDRPSLEAQAEGFEDVGLDEPKPQQAPQPKRRGLFARFQDNDSNSNNASSDNSRPNSSHHTFHFTGRRRAQSGQGAELKSMPRPSAGQPAMQATA